MDSYLKITLQSYVYSRKQNIARRLTWWCIFQLMLPSKITWLYWRFWLGITVVIQAHLMDWHSGNSFYQLKLHKLCYHPLVFNDTAKKPKLSTQKTTAKRAEILLGHWKLDSATMSCKDILKTNFGTSEGTQVESVPSQPHADWVQFLLIQLPITYLNLISTLRNWSDLLKNKPLEDYIKFQKWATLVSKEAIFPMVEYGLNMKQPKHLTCQWW